MQNFIGNHTGPYGGLVFAREKTPGSVSLMLARFPQKRCDDPDCTDWLMRRTIEWWSDSRIHTLLSFRKDDTPIPMSRNCSIEAAKEAGVDFVLMIDSDMSPDLPGPRAIPFWHESFDFALKQRAAGSPCVIAAPYCGPSPHQNVYIFKWETKRNPIAEDGGADMFLTQYGRDEAAHLFGIKEAAALPTGLILIDMRAFEKLAPPYFYYEYDMPGGQDLQAKKASTEDVTFTRDLSLLGVRQFVNWDAWAGHVKFEVVGRPNPITSAWVSNKIRDAVRKEFNVNPGEELRYICPITHTIPSTNGNGSTKHDQPSDQLAARERLKAELATGRERATS